MSQFHSNKNWSIASSDYIEQVRNYTQNKSLGESIQVQQSKLSTLNSLSYQLSTFVYRNKNFRTWSWNSIANEVPRTWYHLNEIWERKFLSSSVLGYKRRVNEGGFVALWQMDYDSKERFHANGSLNKEWMAQHVVLPTYSFQTDWDQEQKLILIYVLYETRQTWYNKRLGINWLQAFQQQYYTYEYMIQMNQYRPSYLQRILAR